MKRFLLVLGACVSGLVSFACSSTRDKPEATFVTFNAMLAEHGGNIDERLGAIASRLNELEPTLVCLQEVWQLEHVERLVSRVKSHLPHAHFTVKGVAGTQGCEPSEVDTMTACFDKFCSAVATDQMPMCASLSCANVFATVSKSCQECVLQNASLGSIASIASSCIAKKETLVYEKQNGLLLLSSQPMRHVEDIELDSTVFARGVLYAEYESDDFGAMRAFCTHLAVTIPAEGDGEASSSEANERAEQIDRLLDFVDEKKVDDTISVVMGDMNCGPKTSGAASADPQDFERLTSRGLKAPYLGRGFGSCSWCSKNDLVPDSDDNQLIDHVLFSGLPKSSVATASRVLDEPFEFKREGETITTELSDHYGVEVRLSQ